MHKRFTRTAFTALVVTTALVAAPLTTGSSAQASGVPVGNIGKFQQNYYEAFTTPAAANGPFARTYANSWQPYPDGMGNGQYWSGSQISAKSGMMDIAMSGTRGAAGTFGTKNGAWSFVGGKFTVRARAVGGDGNGAAFILWPTSNNWSEGEIDYPEANYEAAPMLHQHSMIAGKEDTATSISTRASWRDWHNYSVEWIPGKSVRYLLDDRVIATVTKDVPKTPHRYMFQTGNWGKAGHLYIDWITTYTYKP